MHSAWEYLTYLSRWHGSFLLPLIAFFALAIRAYRKPRRLWIYGALIASVAYGITFTAVFIHDLRFWQPVPNSWVQIRPTQLFQVYSALPIQTIFQVVLGNDSFAERKLLNFDAFAMWVLAGAAIGFVTQKLKRKEPSRPAENGSRDVT